jgi:hypothetical protein
MTVQPSRSDVAAYLTRGLNFGYITVDEVVAWADSIIASEDQPSEAIIDLSLARGRDPLDVAALLASIAGPSDPQVVFRWSMARLARAVDGPVMLEPVWRGTTEWAFDRGIGLPEEVRLGLYLLDDELAFAADDQRRRDLLRAYFARFAGVEVPA